MRTSAISAAVIALTTLIHPVSADDDFSALLADLSFGDAPTVDSLTVANDEPVPSFEPVPTEGLVMPENGTVAIEEEPAVAAEIDATPQVALMDPIPESTPQPTDQVDLEAAFALQDQTPAQVIGHIQYGCHDANCDGCDACQPGCGPSGCGHDAGIVCRPRRKVNLPSSAISQYFRSHPCYTNVWDGYRIHCGPHHKHLHGECDCFNPNKKHCGDSGACFGTQGLVDGCGAPACNDCTGCDTGCTH